MPRTLEEAKAMGLCPTCHDTPCKCTPETEHSRDRAIEALAGYKVKIEKSNLLSGDREAVEQFCNPWQKDRRAYGALPHFDERDRIIDEFPQEAEYFSRHYTPGEGPARRDSSYAQGAMLFEMKFGQKLSAFTEEILNHYPPKGEEGKEISVFGLSGSGKSTVVEVMKEKFGDDAVIMDSDTVRYNLLGKKIKEVETAGGADMDEIQNELMHNNISGALYFALNHVTKELRERGYTVVQSATQPTPGADVTIYVEHPDGIDPRTVSADDREDVAHTLFQRTQARIDGPDNFDWDNADTITDFRKMTDVSVRVPERVHGIFLSNLKKALGQQKDVRMLANPANPDANARREQLEAQLENILG